MSDTDVNTDYEPIKVHVVSAPTSSAPARCRVRSNYQTIKLTAADPSQPILPTSDERVAAYVIPLDDPICISNNQSDAQNFIGAQLPKATDTGSYFPINDSGPMFASAQTFSSGGTSRVTVVAVYEVKVNK